MRSFLFYPPTGRIREGGGVNADFPAALRHLGQDDVAAFAGIRGFGIRWLRVRGLGVRGFRVCRYGVLRRGPGRFGDFRIGIHIDIRQQRSILAPCSRVRVPSGRKLPSGNPFRIPLSAILSTAVLYGVPIPAASVNSTANAAALRPRVRIRRQRRAAARRKDFPKAVFIGKNAPFPSVGGRLLPDRGGRRRVSEKSIHNPASVLTMEM